MKHIKKTLAFLAQQSNLPTLYRLQGYCKAKKYHFYMYNHCVNIENLITYIKITDKNDKEIASQSVNIKTWHPVKTIEQYC